MGPLDSGQRARKIGLAAFGTLPEEVPDSARPASRACTRGRSVERVGAFHIGFHAWTSVPRRDPVSSRAVPPPRQPQHDSIAPSEPEWVTVQLGVGQVPGIFNTGDWQWSPDLTSTAGGDIRRTPGRDHAYVTHRPPGAPA